MSIILKAENISKQYRLGQVGTGTLGHDLNRWWASLRGQEDPYVQVGAVNDRSAKATEDYVWALRDVNFEVMQGEVLGIIGKNGAGKSTLLKILSRVTSPTTGSIKTRGRIASLLEVGTGFHGELSGRENIFMNGAILGMTKSEIKSKLDEIIDFSGCEMYIDTPVKRYSSGMTVRLGFAVAAHLEPEILVVDEVLAVGDAEFQKKAIGKMQDLSIGQGRTVLFVSHNMVSVQNLCKKALVLQNGFINYEGDVAEGIDMYLTENNKNDNELSLLEKPRRGDGKFRIVKITLLNNKGQSRNIFLSGSNITFEIEIENLYNIHIKDLRLDFGLDDSSENRISWFSTILNKEKLDFQNKPIIKIKMIIPKIPLASGTYHLTSNLIVNGVIEDWISKATSFNMENGDFFGTGKIQEKQQGNFLIEHLFKK